MSTEQDVREHNRRELWADVANHLEVAFEAVGQAQGSLEDLQLSGAADMLDPIRDALRRARSDASEAAAGGGDA